MLLKHIIYLCVIHSLLLAQNTVYTFEDSDLTDWKQSGQWEIQTDGNSTYLSLTERSADAFNLVYTNKVAFLNGTITLRFRANHGVIDQGGGIAWRVQDADNYYIARFNPLEDNFRFYIVRDGIRTEISSGEIKLEKGWHTMKITQQGTLFRGFIDGKELLYAKDDRLRKKGGVGIWTKADAMTSFDDLTITKENIK